MKKTLLTANKCIVSTSDPIKKSIVNALPIVLFVIIITVWKLKDSTGNPEVFGVLCFPILNVWCNISKQQKR